MFSQEQIQQLMTLAGIGIICWILLRGKMRRQKAARSGVALSSLVHNGNAVGQPHTFTGTRSLGAPPEILQWQVELHDLGRELKGELDSKMLAVRSLSQTYDQAARRLSQLIELAEQVQIAPDSPLAQARHLTAQGWDHEKIAVHLGIALADIELLLSTPARDSVARRDSHSTTTA
ncbi:hypothetical protein [Aureliella helgolandensis]|uniref:Uncharacterized protein n=1 Tax=Aureliella helgolandensis TaxID=2527968 RepID=A0A518G623_9BACT|nr:hypothetical protein [Aureliella helgolandensis]QDV24042.1 hypothetical protein Q31a_23550 [Aureliella helgolandensis]